jgi:hypothetical protein
MTLINKRSAWHMNNLPYVRPFTLEAMRSQMLHLESCSNTNIKICVLYANFSFLKQMQAVKAREVARLHTKLYVRRLKIGHPQKGYHFYSTFRPSCSSNLLSRITRCWSHFPQDTILYLNEWARQRQRYYTVIVLKQRNQFTIVDVNDTALYENETNKTHGVYGYRREYLPQRTRISG